MIEEFGADGFEGKVATVGLADEIAMVREVRAAIGPARELRLDANGGWTVPTARMPSGASTPYDVRYYEDPVETLEEMAALRPATRASFSSHLVDLRRASSPRRARHGRLEPERVRRHPADGRIRPRLRAVRRRLPVPQRRDGDRQRRVPAAVGRARACPRAEPDAAALVRRRRDRRGAVRAPRRGGGGAGRAGPRRDPRPGCAGALPRALPHRGSVPRRPGTARLRRDLPPHVESAG